MRKIFSSDDRYGLNTQNTQTAHANQYKKKKSGQKTRIDISPKKTSRWPTGTEKDAHYCQSSGKCKSKPPGGITLHLSEWLSSTRTQITNVGEDVEKTEYFYTAGGNVNWCRYC